MKTVKILLLGMMLIAAVSTTYARAKRNNRETRAVNGARLIGNDRSERICYENSGVLQCYTPGEGEIPQ